MTPMTPPDGRHLSFPFRIAADGRSAQTSSRDEQVRDEIIQLLLTSPGERAFLPEFGGGARRLVFENIADTTEAMTKAMITQAVARWLGQRITLQTLDIVTRQETITIDITYQLAGQDDSRRLRFQRSGG